MGDIRQHDPIVQFVATGLRAYAFPVFTNRFPLVNSAILGNSSVSVTGKVYRMSWAESFPASVWYGDGRKTNLLTVAMEADIDSTGAIQRTRSDVTELCQFPVRTVTGNQPTK